MKIVCFGDSLTTCGGESSRFSDILQDRFPDHEFINRGAGGESFVEALARFDADVLAEQPDIALIEYGANDWWRDERAPDAWATDLENIVTRLQAGGARVVVLGVFGPHVDDAGERVEKQYGIDERAVRYRAMEADVAARHDCPYIPNIQERIINRRCCWRDRNHPNEYGNRHVADTIQPTLERMLNTTGLPVRLPTLHTTRDMWDEAVTLAPGNLAVVDGDQRLTYGEAAERVEQLANGLAACAGAAPKVAVFLPNGLAYYLVYWAVVRLGGVIVPLNTWLKQDGLAGILGHVRPDVLIVESEANTDVLAAAKESFRPPCVLALEPGTDNLDALNSLFGDAPPAPPPPIEADAVSIIMHTSGTTAMPKGAVMRHRDLMFNVMTTINAHHFGASDVHLLVNPMFHCTALYSSLPTAAYTKTPVIITTPTRTDELLSCVERERITTFLSIPAVFQQILKLKELDTIDVSSLRIMAYAGSPMPVGTIQRLAARFPDIALHNFFGLTETISMTHVLRGDEATERPDSIGRLLPFVEARVVDEAGEECPSGTVGELLFARENIISEYYGHAELLDQSLITHDGRTWFRTGDLAMVDEEGYFFIKGRKKDMIIVGGENVFAVEVEALLQSHEGVEEAAVKGAPATGALSFMGEQVNAYVVRRDPSLTERDLRGFCFKRVPSYKVPRRIVFLDALPRNPSGKVVKGDLE